MAKGHTRIVRTERIDRLARDLARCIVDRWGGRDAPAGRLYVGVIEPTGGGLVLKVFTKGTDQQSREETRGGVTPGVAGESLEQLNDAQASGSHNG